MSDVFISYSREDAKAARELAELIGTQRIEVWWDPELRAGQDFAQVIEHVLASVKCVVVLWSRHSVLSRWVRAEAREGLQANKLVPVALDDSEPPLIFRGLHTARFEPDDLQAGSLKVEKLLADIRAMLAGTPEDDAGGTRKARPRSMAAGNGSDQAVRRIWIRNLLVTAGAGAAVLLGMALLDLPGRMLDYATGVICAAGFPGNPAAVEGLILAALLAMAGVAGARLHLLGNAHLRWILPCLVPCILAAGILLQWSLRFALPRPDHLYGRVQASNLSAIRVYARDCHGGTLSLGDAPVDTMSGDFGLRLKPMFADRPRAVVLNRPGCAEHVQPVPWRQWREKKNLEITFRCRGE